MKCKCLNDSSLYYPYLTRKLLNILLLFFCGVSCVGLETGVCRGGSVVVVCIFLSIGMRYNIQTYLCSSCCSVVLNSACQLSFSETFQQQEQIACFSEGTQFYLFQRRERLGQGAVCLNCHQSRKSCMTYYPDSSPKMVSPASCWVGGSLWICELHCFMRDQQCPKSLQVGKGQRRRQYSLCYVITGKEML